MIGLELWSRQIAIGLGPSELSILLIALVVLFGAKKLPELAKGMGEGIKEFKKAVGPDEEEPAKPSASAEGDSEKESDK